MNITIKHALLFLVAYPVFLFSQSSSSVDCRIYHFPVAAKGALSNPASFDFNIEYLEIPLPDGNSYWTALQNQKQEQTESYLPQGTDTGLAENRSAQEPQLFQGFVGNNSSSGVPLDNHLSISNDGQIISVVNRHVAVKNTDGGWLGAATLENFTSPLNIAATKYDPKTLYDPVHDRFVIVMLAGFESNSSRIILAVSETNDASADWIYYTLPGNPFDTDNWSDYPMISLNESSLFITVNQIKDNEPWETGFTETLIWKLALEEMYNAEDIFPELFSGIGYNGQPIRNICPVQYATEDRSDQAFFLSNRNFDLENDTIFFLEMSIDPDSGAVFSPVIALEADQAYGMPPNVEQEVGFLSTNDSRILDAVLIDKEIHFVSNSIDFSTGKASVYHGMIDDISNPGVTSSVLSPTDERCFAYPSLAYTGDNPLQDKDLIIITSHASETIYSGFSALYRASDGTFSNWIYAKEGDDYIDMINGMGGFERWGDYSACQRKYDEPGVVWAVSSFGEGFKDAETWIARLARPDYVNTTDFNLEQTISLQTYPNPVTERFSLDMDLPEDCKKLEVMLFSSEGRLLKVLYDDKPKRKGEVRLSMETSHLSPGVYQLLARVNGSLFGETKVIVSR